MDGRVSCRSSSPCLSLLPGMLTKRQVSKAEAGALPRHMPAAPARGWPGGTGEVIRTLVRKGRVPQSVRVSRSLRGKEDRKRTLPEHLASCRLTPGGKPGRKHCACLGVTALSCASRVRFGCLGDSRSFDEWLGEGRSLEDHGLSD